MRFTTLCAVSLFGILLVLMPFGVVKNSSQENVEARYVSSVFIAHAAVGQQSTFSFWSLWDDVLSQVHGVFAFTAQAIQAVGDVPQRILSNGDFASSSSIVDRGVDAARKSINSASTFVSNFSNARTGTLVMNIPLFVHNAFTTTGETNLASTTVHNSLTVSGNTNLNSLFADAAAMRSLRVSGDTNLSRLSVLGASSLGSLLVSQGAQVQGGLVARGGIETFGADAHLGTGRIFASNIVNSITAGTNVTITGTRSDPIISVRSMGGGGSSGVDSFNGLQGALTLVAGDDIQLSGLTINNISTLGSVRSRGGCTNCITDSDVTNALSIVGGTIDGTVIGSTTASSARFTTLTVTDTATSTFGGSINLTDGCFAVAGECIGASIVINELVDLLDVDAASSSAGDLLMYNGSMWVNAPASSLGLGDNTFLGLLDTPDAFIANALSFVNASGTALTQSANLVFTGTRLGVGTSSPSNTLSVAGDIGILGQQGLRFYDANNSNYVSFRASSTVASNVSWTLPVSDGSLNQLLVTDGSGNLRFADVASVGGGADTFLELTDTANAFINKAIPYVASSTLTFSPKLTFDGTNLTVGMTASTSVLSVVGSARFGSSTSSPSFVYDYLSDSVGIGTANPSELLTVEGGSFLQQGAAPGGSYVPTQVGSIDLPDNVNNVFVLGKFAYTVSGSAGNEFTIIDISNPALPIQVGSTDLPASANDVYVSGKYAYAVSDVTGNDFHVIDVSDSGNPVEVSSLNLSTSAFGVTVQGRYAYVTTGGTGNDFHVIDIGNPLVPREIGSLNLPTAANAVAVSGSYAYVALDSLGDEFYVIDISVPTAPVTVDTVNLSSSASDVSLKGSYAYVTSASTGNDLHVIDIGDPTAAVEVGGIDLVTGATGIALAGNYAYIMTASTGNDVHVVNISNPLVPVEVGSEDLASGSGLGIAVAGKFAYAVTSATGDDLHIMDITGIESQSLFAHSLQTGELSVFGDIVTGGNVSFGLGVRAGIDGLQTDGSLFAQGSDDSFFLGQLGIGTTTPSNNLTVSGNARITGALFDNVNASGTNGMVLKSTGTGFRWVATSTLGFVSSFSTSAQLGALLSDETGTGNVVFSASPTFTGTLNVSAATFSSALTFSGTAANVALGTNYLSGDGADEGIYVDSTGKVGIGTSTPAQQLSVAGTIAATNLLGGVTSLSTDAQGNIIRTPSDAIFKTDVVTISDALNKVLALRGVSYQWIDTERFGNQSELGFIAQEVDLILPEVVHKGGDYWSLNTPNILAVVVEAIKEMWVAIQGDQEQIRLLKERVEKLETELQITDTSSPSSDSSPPQGPDIPATSTPLADGNTAPEGDTQAGEDTTPVVDSAVAEQSETETPENADSSTLESADL